MPELPDVELYVARLRERIVGQRLKGFRTFGPFVLRSVSPTPESFVGEDVVEVSRLGKRLVFGFAGGRSVVVHLMIAGRFQWSQAGAKGSRAPGKVLLARWEFDGGELGLVEFSPRRRASIHCVGSAEELSALGRGGQDVRTIDSDAFCQVLRKENRTLKRALTHPAWFDGIGNAYSDEILFWAKLPPTKLTRSLSESEAARLHQAAVDTLVRWTETLQREIPAFPKPSEITAFRPDFAVHGRFGKPCPGCGHAVQRIVYAENEANYCALCQNAGRLLADRSLSRLLKSEWPKTLEEREAG